MAAAVAYLTDAMADLARQLAFAPAATMRKQVAQAVALAGELDPDQAYPMSFVAFRVTGFRVDRGLDDLVPGSSIRADLCTFALEASRRAPRRPDGTTGPATTIAELATRWSVSERTLRRWRRFGLALEWFDLGGDEPSLGVLDSVAEGVQLHHARIVARAGKFRRLAPAERAKVVDAVARERTHAASLAQAQRAVAERHGITPEAVRLICQSMGAQHRRAAKPDGWFARCAARGIPVAMIAASAGLSAAHTSRRVVADRAAMLARTLPHVPALPTFVHPEAASVLLAAPWLSKGLDHAAPTDAACACTHRDATAGRDFPALAAMRYLLWRARAGVVGPARPGAVERAEVDARWAAMLLRTVVAWHTPSLLQRLAAMLNAPVLVLPAEPLRVAVELAQACVVGAAFQVDLSSVAPGRLRLDRIAQLAFEHQLTRQPSVTAAGRAPAVHAGPVPIGDAVMRACGWIGVVDAGCGQRAGARLVGGEVLRLLTDRHGWDGDRPGSVDDLAARARTSRQAMQVRLADAADEARLAWRASRRA
jgi:hypothetical protein